MPKVLNEDLQTLCSRFFSVLVDYSPQLSHIPLGKDITLIFWSFKVVIYSFTQLIKRNTKGVTLEVGVIVVKGQAAQHGRVGLAKLLFRDISLLIEVYKDSQFKVKIIIFTTILRFVGIKLSQVGQLLAVGLCLGGLQVYGLRVYSLRIYSMWVCSLRIYGLRIYSLRIYRLWICSLNNRGSLVHILVYRGIIVYSLRVGYGLANRISSKTTQVYRTNLVKYIRYKASNLIKFRRSKEFIFSIGLVQDFLLSLFHLVLLIYYII